MAKKGKSKPRTKSKKKVKGKDKIIDKVPGARATQTRAGNVYVVETARRGPYKTRGSGGGGMGVPSRRGVLGQPFTAQPSQFTGLVDNRSSASDRRVDKLERKIDKLSDKLFEQRLNRRDRGEPAEEQLQYLFSAGDTAGRQAGGGGRGRRLSEPLSERQRGPPLPPEERARRNTEQQEAIQRREEQRRRRGVSQDRGGLRLEPQSTRQQQFSSMGSSQPTTPRPVIDARTRLLRSRRRPPPPEYEPPLDSGAGVGDIPQLRRPPPLPPDVDLGESSTFQDIPLTEEELSFGLETIQDEPDTDEDEPDVALRGRTEAEQLDRGRQQPQPLPQPQAEGRGGIDDFYRGLLSNMSHGKERFEPSIETRIEEVGDEGTQTEKSREVVGDYIDDLISGIDFDKARARKKLKEEQKAFKEQFTGDPSAVPVKPPQIRRVRDTGKGRQTIQQALQKEAQRNQSAGIIQGAFRKRRKAQSEQIARSILDDVIGSAMNLSDLTGNLGRRFESPISYFEGAGTGIVGRSLQDEPQTLEDLGVSGEDQSFLTAEERKGKKSQREKEILERGRAREGKDYDKKKDPAYLDFLREKQVEKYDRLRRQGWTPPFADEETKMKFRYGGATGTEGQTFTKSKGSDKITIINPIKQASPVAQKLLEEDFARRQKERADYIREQERISKQLGRKIKKPKETKKKKR